jgi:SCY1-like protein 1
LFRIFKRTPFCELSFIFLHDHAISYFQNLEDKEEVAIFKYLKTQKDKLVPAQRAIQKMKTLKHPHILSYIESAEYEDSLVLVTEGCVPLQVWLQTAAKNNQNEESRHQELLWGLKCVLETLQFLHNNGLVHSYLGLHAIFVAKSGDWKIGALDLLGNMTLEDDFNFLKSYANLLARPYIAPERQQPLVFISEAEKTSKVAVGSGADIFSLAHCIETCYATADLTVPEGLSKYFTRMLSIDPKRRPTASQLIKCPVFSSDNIKLMATLGDLAALKPANETLEALGQLSEKVPILPISICIHKILPSLSRTLQMACTDFNNRDARESCRQVTAGKSNILNY